MAYQLENICLFSTLDVSQLNALRRISTIKQFKEGNILFYEGENPKHLYFLLEGLVKLYRYDNDNKVAILHYYYTQSLIGEAASLQRTPHQTTAECDTDSTILMVEYEAFAKHFLRNPDIAIQIIMQLVSKVKHLMNNRVPQSSMQKIAQLIYENSDLFTKVKKYKIANILNMTPETFSRNLKKLKKEGIISYSSTHFDVLDPVRLAELFNSCQTLH
jgi:CRP/FNR family transcriptional regulator